MAITYKWTINQMNAHIQAEGEDNVIYTVHWTYSGSEESGGETYQASSSMQASLEANINLQITPINEDLYFTWQNPTPPPAE